MNFILKIVVISVNAFFLAFISPGVAIADFSTAIIVAAVMAILDALIRPLIILLMLPANMITFGLILFIVNALVIIIDAHYVHGFDVENFGHALLFSLFLSLANSIVFKLISVLK